MSQFIELKRPNGDLFYLNTEHIEDAGETEDGYVFVNALKTTILLSNSFSDLRKLLEPKGFVFFEKKENGVSYLYQPSYFLTIDKNEDGTATLFLINGEIIVTETFYICLKLKGAIDANP